MVSPSQQAGLQSYWKAREDGATAAAQQLRGLITITDLRRDLAAAQSIGDAAQAATLEGAMKAAQRDADAAAAAVRAAHDGLATGRRAALAKGDGFDLLAAEQPLLLLPVRLETRFAWTSAGETTFTEVAGSTRVLLVRVLPDLVHEDSFEPALTQPEMTVLLELRKALKQARDQIHLVRAWSRVVAELGPLRAGWLGEVLRDPTLREDRPDRYTRPATARLLPDRWVAVAELADGSTRTAMSRLVQEPLETGLDPGTAEWMTDFNLALKAGMGLVVSGIPAGDTVVSQLVVVGARGTLDPARSAQELADVLRSHHYSRGLSLLLPGTPTNAALGMPSAYSTRPDLADVLPLETRRFLIGGRPDPLCHPGQPTAGAELASALGLPTTPLEYVAGAAATTQEDARALREVLVSATRRHLTRLTAGVLDPQTLGTILGFGVNAVSPVGPLPPLRLGPQPYGILPLLLRTAGQPATGSTAREILEGLDRFRAVWDAAVDRVDRVGRPGADPGTTLIRILQQDGVPRRIALRPMLGPQSAAEVAAGLGAAEARALARVRAGVAAALDALGSTGSAGSSLVSAMNLEFASAVTAPLVQPVGTGAASPQRLAAFLELAATTRPDRLLLHDYSGAARPVSLLYAFARVAMLDAADEAARAVLVASGADPSRWDDEEPPSPFVDPYGTLLARLTATDPADGVASIAVTLGEGGTRGDLVRLRGLLRGLATRDPATLEELLRASLALFSTRLDAWYTGLASDRLAEVRNTHSTASGLNIAAYGVLEEITPTPRRVVAGKPDLFENPLGAGYIHAPSAGHGAAAAVLRSVHLAHAAAGHGGAFSVDLSSARVRSAVELVDGLHEGQPLPALLGYRVERALAAEGLQRYIAGLRKAAPLVANQLTPSNQPDESVAASNVVDGLALLALAGYDRETPPSVAQLWQSAPSLGSYPGTGDEAALGRVLLTAWDALDGAADLAVAESVYQTVRGNPGRAGGTVDGLAGAPVPPQDAAVAQTPRAGVGVTHRLTVLLEAPPSTPLPVPPDGWAWTPRAGADERIEMWARATLPAPAQILVRATYVDDEGAELPALELSLADLDAAARGTHQELQLGARDLVQLGDPQNPPGTASLDQRIRALVELRRPAGAGDVGPVLDYERQDGWPAESFSLAEAQEIARQLRTVLGHGRPLEPGDLSLPASPVGVAVDTADLGRRAAEAAAVLADVRDGLVAALTVGDADVLRAALFRADALGSAGAAPMTIRDRGTVVDGRVDDEAVQEAAIALAGLRHQAEAAQTELDHRQGLVEGRAADDWLGRLAAPFGPGFVVLPVLGPVSVATGLLGPGARAGGATDSAITAWLGRAAAVREPVEALDRLLGHAEAVAAVDPGRPRPAMHVGQLGGPQGERWVALEPVGGTAVPGGRVGIVALTPGPGLPTAGIAGLLIDEWVEVVPATDQTTSVTFGYDAPSSEPAQVLLLGVPPTGHEQWTAQEARQLVEEALGLARIRLVDVDHLTGVGQLLPALVTAENSAGDVAALGVEALTEPEA